MAIWFVGGVLFRGLVLLLCFRLHQPVRRWVPWPLAPDHRCPVHCLGRRLIVRTWLRLRPERKIRVQALARKVVTLS
ncbi:hypothetical protein J7F02_19320 [Streptomyces sp. ISL-112]|uniref:hypothetical protein n=1 Tax=unclassified Streptomyces TaxID=2593676 RepID=UPI001BE81736|nr:MULTISPECIES: hypothetical protein [unclassified Streptomyces]MBT2427758.1 hypothetical protein [Streptomyces sp. ISL-112]MBT2464539.1 hypothetical protein [Streptomyces sp. ISL-63]